ncbi:MAG: protease complex subunit PrcB family protein [Clostridiales bacterium]|nr:protease complex subunit PrcB family protein [Clostridiales bacterium]
MRKLLFFLIFIFTLSLLLISCQIVNQDDEKLADLEFYVVEEREIPEGLKTKIAENKTSEFKITYKDGEYLYIAIGYGERPTGGYSIAVNELYLGENFIHITTTLIGPSKDETVTQVLTYPYIVVRTAFREENVVFH